eukprot:Platyproteum_vivax@DN4906_c0_g1_i2.p1
MSFYLSESNFPRDGTNRVYHLGLQEGELSNRILTVGSHSRGESIGGMLTDVKVVQSNRGFHTYTGTYNDVKVSVVAVGMGVSAIDFLIREGTAVLKPDEPMVVIRFGTCGLLDRALPPGTVVIADQARFCSVDYNSPGGYLISTAASASAPLSSTLRQCLSSVETVSGLNISAETFYASQGRLDANFNDNNGHLLDKFTEMGSISCEMEIHQLFYLASLRKAPTHVAACAVGLVNRHTSTAIKKEKLVELEDSCGRSCLEALTKFVL